MKPPYGARTRISSCISIGLVDPPMFYSFCKAQHHLSIEQSKRFANKLDRAIEPAIAVNNEILFPPYVVVCHDTRCKENNYVGLTRILGIGRFGEFAALTLEKVNKQIVDEFRRKKQEIKSDDLCAEYHESAFLVILRIYSSTNPGKRSLNYKLRVISPQKDLGIDTDQIRKEAYKRYHID